MRAFRRLTIATLVAVYLLILVGGIVRSTGSGMGCPDWPKCFGNWVPPTSVHELPSNYKEIYSTYRAKKNEKFARYLKVFGFTKTAEALLNNKDVLQEADFNPTRTWIEYLNRIVGVVIGFLIFAVFVSSVRLWKDHKSITIIACLSFILVVFQGWIGSFVVSTNLTAWTVTLHMFLALLLVALLIVLIVKSNYEDVFERPVGFWITLACIVVTLVQILLGTQVREAVDSVAGTASRSEWLAAVGAPFIIHRSFSWIVLILHAGLMLNLMKTQGLKPFTLGVIVLILGTILTGAGMAYGDIPAWLQPVHLVLATLSFGMQFMLILKLRLRKQTSQADLR
jgi:cytochrome c oxidase assembly protein subunit 15